MKKDLFRIIITICEGAAIMMMLIGGIEYGFFNFIEMVSNHFEIMALFLMLIGTSMGCGIIEKCKELEFNKGETWFFLKN